MNEQYMRLRKEWREAKDAVARAEALYNNLAKQSKNAFAIRDDVINEVAKTQAFLERLDAQRPTAPAPMLDCTSHFNKVALIAKACAYDRLVKIAKGSNGYECALYDARYPDPPDED